MKRVARSGHNFVIKARERKHSCSLFKRQKGVLPTVRGHDRLTQIGVIAPHQKQLKYCFRIDAATCANGTVFTAFHQPG